MSKAGPKQHDRPDPPSPDSVGVRQSRDARQRASGRPSMTEYVRNSWYPIAWSDELDSGPLGRRLLDEPVMVFRTEEGAPAALEDRCCHKFLPLSKGRVRGDCIECGYHGMQYDATGACRKSRAKNSSRRISACALIRSPNDWGWSGSGPARPNGRTKRCCSTCALRKSGLGRQSRPLHPCRGALSAIDRQSARSGACQLRSPVVAGQF